jgi:hypothetical protein
LTLKVVATRPSITTLAVLKTAAEFVGLRARHAKK